jgi:23S rRNA (uridine2552-2'-O)-methyltransferase
VACRARGALYCACARRARGASRACFAVANYQRKDHFHQRAKREGVRSRAFYKLDELQKRHRLLKRGQVVIDLGCWPGGWLQAAAKVVGANGRVVGVDLAAIDPPLELENVTTIVGDLADPAVCDRVRELAGRRCDVLLSDAAPKLTGLRDVDRANEERLLEAIEAALGQLLGAGGDALIKILDGPEAVQIDRRIRRRFASAKTVVPAATRKGSSERYLLARGHGQKR